MVPAVATTAIGNGDNNWWVATLDAIDATTGAVRPIAQPKTQINAPRVSPDGKTVAYIGGLMSDFGSVGGDIWTVPFAGGDPVDMTKGEKASVTSLVWTNGGLRSTRLMGPDMQIAAPGAKGTRWRFDADGIGSRESEGPTQSGGVAVVDSNIKPHYGYHWSLDGNDLIQQYTSGGATENCDLGTPACYVSKDLRIVPLARVGTRTYVLESTRFGEPDVSQGFSRFTAIVYYEYEPFVAPVVNGVYSRR